MAHPIFNPTNGIRPHPIFNPTNGMSHAPHECVEEKTRATGSLKTHRPGRTQRMLEARQPTLIFDSQAAAGSFTFFLTNCLSFDMMDLLIRETK